MIAAGAFHEQTFLLIFGEAYTVNTSDKIEGMNTSIRSFIVMDEG